MELQEVMNRMREKASIIERERERIANFVEELEAIYINNKQSDSAKTCRIICDHLRTM